MSKLRKGTYHVYPAWEKHLHDLGLGLCWCDPELKQVGESSDGSDDVIITPDGMLDEVDLVVHRAFAPCEEDSL
jgi:hypothetical protein